MCGTLGQWFLPTAEVVTERYGENTFTCSLACDVSWSQALPGGASDQTGSFAEFAWRSFSRKEFSPLPLT